jgi:hypothetical protein
MNLTENKTGEQDQLRQLFQYSSMIPLKEKVWTEKQHEYPYVRSSDVCESKNHPVPNDLLLDTRHKPITYVPVPLMDRKKKRHLKSSIRDSLNCNTGMCFIGTNKMFENKPKILKDAEKRRLYYPSNREGQDAYDTYFSNNGDFVRNFNGGQS